MTGENKNYKKSFFYTFLVFGILVEAITITIIFGLNYFDIQEKIKQKYDIEKTDKLHTIANLVNQSENSINSIIKSENFKNYLENEDDVNTQNINNLFSYILDENTNYMQIRYIDKFGKENLRIDKKDGKIHVIDKKNMQDKSKRYYFKKTIEQKNDNFWYSHIDLNMENGKIQIPYNPTFRIAKKVIYNNQLKGIIIINIQMQSILSQLINSWNFDINLIDENGYVIYSLNNNESWAKDLKKDNDFFIKNGIDKANSNFDTYSKGGLFFQDLSNIILSKEKMYLVYKNKGILVQSIKKSNYYATLWVMLLVFLLSIPLAFAMSNIPSKLYARLINSLIKIKEFSQIIDKYVMSLSIDEEGKIKETSTAFIKKSNFDKSEIIGQKHEDIISHPKKEDVANETTLKNGEMIAKDKHGSHFWVEQTVSPIQNKKGNLQGYASILFDITEKKEIKKQSLTDYLTSLPNRRCLDDSLERELELSHRYKTTFSIFLLDIDDFKNINDTYGHPFGDKILKQIASIMIQHIRNTDIVGRFGGEEFLVILPYTELEGAIITAENFRKEIQNYEFENGCKITASFGVTVNKSDDTNILNIIERADEALYDAKNNGKNRVESII